KDQLFQLSDSVHILRAGEINLSTSKSAIGIKNAVLYPVITSEKYKGLKTTFQVSIPDLAIRNINFERAWYTRNLNLAKLTINNAKFQVYTQPGSFKSLELKKFNFPLPAGVNSLEVGELQVNNGEVMTFETKGIQHKAISNFKIDISIPDLVLKNNPNKEAELKTSNLKLTISDFYSPLGITHYINTGKIIFNKQQQTLFVKSLKINPFESLKKGNRFYINAPEINFTGFDFNEALDNNNFIFDEISILKPQLNVEMNDSVRDDKLDFLQTMDLYPYTEPYVDRISVNNLMLNGAKIKFNWFQKQLIDKEINFSFSDILIAKNQPASNLLNSSEFEISTTNLRTTSKNNLYEFTAEALIYNSAKHNILLKTLAVKPLLEKSEFPKIKGFQTDVITATVDFAELQQIDEKRWLKDNVLDARLLKIGPAKLEFFRNKRYPFNHSQRPQWPQDIIRSIKQPFVFDSVALMPTYLKYSELTPVAETPGFIGFYELQFTAGQLSNIKSEINRFKHFKINASTKFYNRAKLSANFDFDLLSTDYYHTVSGSLSDMPMLPFNNIIEKSAPVIIESGNINRFDFDMVLRKNESEGVLYFGYENFKISLLDYSNEEVKRSKWASFWANKLILNTDTKNGDKLEPVSLLYERDPERSIINYWWKTLFSGAQKKLGIEPKK
ncbi:MAG TPA: hypothetical protein VKA10_00845, partial [Prolixibacteraceae bacterium]|nr:hypothetical protein [Prolixibacteraceae bacterium]